MKFTVFKYRKTGSILLLRPPQFVIFFFAKNRNTQLLCCGLELPIRGFTESILCSLLVWKWNAKKSWKQLESARPERSHWSKLSFLFILVIARVIERVDTLAWRVLPGKMFLLERLNMYFQRISAAFFFLGLGWRQFSWLSPDPHSTYR